MKTGHMKAYGQGNFGSTAKRALGNLMAGCAVGVLGLLPLISYAERPLLSVTETVRIDAEPNAVWERIRDFDGLPSWHPAIAKSRIINGINNQPGAARELTVKDGPTLQDELISLNDQQRYFIYRLVDSPLPLSDYLSTVAVLPKGNGSEVLWTVTFKRKNASATPPMTQTDTAAAELLSGVYRTGLVNLKKILENPRR